MIERNRATVNKPSFSKLVVAPPDGRLVFVSGHVATDARGVVQHPDDMHAQSAYIFRAIAAALDKIGGNLTDVVKLTAFLTDMTKYQEYSSARAAAFKDPYPASSAVGVAALIRPGLLVEVEAVAMIRQPGE